MSCTFWFDVEDLFHYARNNSRPSGIQRVSFEICRAMQRRYGCDDRVRFVRHSVDGRFLEPVDWETLERTFGDIAEKSTVMSELEAQTAPNGHADKRLLLNSCAIRRFLRRVVSHSLTASVSPWCYFLYSKFRPSRLFLFS